MRYYCIVLFTISTFLKWSKVNGTLSNAPEDVIDTSDFDSVYPGLDYVKPDNQYGVEADRRLLGAYNEENEDKDDNDRKIPWPANVDGDGDNRRSYGEYIPPAPNHKSNDIVRAYDPGENELGENDLGNFLESIANKLNRAGNTVDMEPNNSNEDDGLIESVSGKQPVSYGSPKRSLGENGIDESELHYLLDSILNKMNRAENSDNSVVNENLNEFNDVLEDILGEKQQPLINENMDKNTRNNENRGDKLDKGNTLENILESLQSLNNDNSGRNAVINGLNENNGFDGFLESILRGQLSNIEKPERNAGDNEVNGKSGVKLSYENSIKYLQSLVNLNPSRYVESAPRTIEGHTLLEAILNDIIQSDNINPIKKSDTNGIDSLDELEKDNIISKILGPSDSVIFQKMQYSDDDRGFDNLERYPTLSNVLHNKFLKKQPTTSAAQGYQKFNPFLSEDLNSMPLNVYIEEQAGRNSKTGNELYDLDLDYPFEIRKFVKEFLRQYGKKYGRLKQIENDLYDANYNSFKIDNTEKSFRRPDKQYFRPSQPQDGRNNPNSFSHKFASLLLDKPEYIMYNNLWEIFGNGSKLGRPSYGGKGYSKIGHALYDSQDPSYDNLQKFLKNSFKSNKPNIENSRIFDSFFNDDLDYK